MLLSDLSIIVRGSSIFSTRALSDYHINGAELIILMYLFANTGMNQDAIAKYFMLDKGSVARTLQKLEEKGFIERSVNEDNQREKLLSLTEQSQTVKAACFTLLSQWNDVMFDGLEKAEIKTFQTLTEKISNNVMNHLNEKEKSN